VATAAAFAITERLKLVKSPIYGTVISPVFSPVCACANAKAAINLGFRHRDRVDVIVLDGRRNVVRTIVFGRLVARGVSVFHWDGSTDVGPRAPDGRYRVQVHLEGQHRTILLPNVVVLDTTPPDVLDAQPNRPQLSPDGDRLGDTVTIHYVLSEPAHVLVYFHDLRIIQGRSRLLRGGVVWTGRINGRLLKRGITTLTVGAVDLAGNVTPLEARARVSLEIRYIALANHRITGIAAGSHFDIGVSTDAKRYRWRLGKRSGVASGPVLRLRAPVIPGRFTLTVTEHGHSDAAAVIVG